MASPAKSSSSSPASSSSQIDLPPEIVKMIQDGSAVVAQVHVLKATYENHYARNPIFPCDMIVSNIGHALHEDIVVIKLEDPSKWTKKTSAPGDSEKKPSSPSVSSPAATASRQNDDGENEDEEDQNRVSHSQHADGRTIVDGIKGRANHIKKAELPELLQARYCNNGVIDRHANMLGTKLREQWNSNIQPHGVVEYIVQRKKATDRLQSCLFFVSQGQKAPLPIKKERWYRFKSYNVSYPFIAIYGADIPTQYQNESITDYLYMVQLKELGNGYLKDEKKENWVDGRYPVGVVLRSIGSAGTVEAESIAITATNQIRDFPFDDEVQACIAETCPIPSKEELAKTGRTDLRDTEFVTSIDPATARDLDDALSICEIPGGYRVGVHIADVSHFVPKDTALDFEASQRCTSTYLVERVVPMLPSMLCEDYCSLNAGVDKFAFSGIWTFDKEGKVLTEWFGQSIIRNRCRMTYDDAQRIIEGDESGDSLNFVNETAPRSELVQKVVDGTKLLYKLSLKMKEQRVAKGAISLGKKKLGFIFQDQNSRLAPIGFRFDTQKEANRLVEEFMLWANFRVAEKVFEFLPRVTLLRQHSPPVKQKLQRFIEQAHRHGYKNFKMSSGKTGKALREALESYKEDPNYTVLSFMVVICMSLAKYVCSSQGLSNEEYEHDGPNDKAEAAAREYMAKNAGKRGHQFEKNLDEDQKPKENHKKDMKKESASGNKEQAGDDQVSLGHFALAAPYYCHFTSPIRRYADLITHRQLLLALDIEREIKKGVKAEDIDIDELRHGHYFYEEDEILEIAVRCNKLKELAKKSGAMSTQLFLSIFLDALKEKEKRRLIADAVESAGTLESLNNNNNNKKNDNDNDEKEVKEQEIKFYATGIVVRTTVNTFTVQLRELALEVEIYHNAKAQLWEGENEVDEDSGDFKIQWPGRTSKEECSIFSELVGEVVTINNPITQTYFVILPPNKRSNLRMVTDKMRLD